MKKVFIVIISLFLSWNSTQAQQNGIEVGFAYDNYFGDNAGSGQLMGIRLSYEQMKELFGRSGSWRSGFQFSFGDYNHKLTATRNSNFSSIVMPNQIEVKGVTNYRSLQFEITQKMYFGNGNFQYGGFYLLFGFGFNTVARETTLKYPTINDSQYYTIKDSPGSGSETIYQATLNIGGGYEFHMEYFNLFIESDLNTPLFAIKDIDLGEFEFDDRGHNYYGLVLGIRINFPY